MHHTRTQTLAVQGELQHASHEDTNACSAGRVSTCITQEHKRLQCKESCNMHHTRTQVLAVQGELQHASHKDTSACSAPENSLVTYAHIIA